MGESTSDRLLRETREAREAEQASRTRRMQRMSRDLLSLLACVPDRLRGDRPMEVNGWCHAHRTPTEEDLREMGGMMAQAAKQANAAHLAAFWTAHYRFEVSLMNEIDQFDRVLEEARAGAPQALALARHITEQEEEIRNLRYQLEHKG